MEKIQHQLLSVILCSFCISAIGCKLKGDKPTTFNFVALDTLCGVRYWGKNLPNMEIAIEKAVLDIEQKMSLYDSESEVSHLNRGNPIPISKETGFVISTSLQIAQWSNGLYDPTIAPLISLWDMGGDAPSVPSNEQINAVMPLINYRNVSVNEEGNEARLNRSGMALDLGGIAKGYAADRIRDILFEYKIETAIINLGGNVSLVGKKPDGTPWKVGVRDDGMSAKVILNVPQGKSVVTSGANERYFEEGGKRYHHIIDPRTGHPADSGVMTVTVLHELSVEADALATAFFIMGHDEGLRRAHEVEAEVLFITNDKRIYATEELQNLIASVSDDYLLAPASVAER